MGKHSLREVPRVPILRSNVPPPVPEGPAFIALLFPNEGVADVGPVVGLLAHTDILLALEDIDAGELVVESTDEAPPWAHQHGYFALYAEKPYGRVIRAAQRGLSDYQVRGAVNILRSAFTGFAQQGGMSIFAAEVARMQQAEARRPRSGLVVPND